jgi:hypothetical protein
VGDESVTWLDRLKRRPVVAGALAIFIAVSGVLGATKGLNENIAYFVNWLAPKPDNNVANAFSSGLLIGNLLFAKAPRVERSKDNDSGFAVPPPPPPPSRWTEKRDSDITALQQILDDMKIKFDPSNFKLDPVFSDSACTMTAVNQLYDAFNSKFGNKAASAFRDGCFLRTIWFSQTFGRIKATSNDGTKDEKNDIQSFLEETIKRYGMKADIERDFAMGIQAGDLARTLEKSLGDRLDAKVRGQLQLGL